MASTGEEHGLFWNSENGDRTYDANSFEYWLKKFFTSGVFEGDLQVQATSGMTLKVGSGYANTDGKVKFWNAEFSIVLDAANSTYPRIDTIVITRDNVNRTITCEKVTGAYSVDAPQPTPPVRDSETWQLVIAQVYVPAGATGITQSNITDTRPDPDLCGYITGTVTEMDFSQFSAQFEAYYNEFVAGHEADFDTWEATQQAAYAAWYAEVVAQMQDDHEAFEDWFENLQNQLDTDQLTHLQAQIDDLYSMAPAGSYITVTTEETTLYSMDVTITDGTHTITSEFNNEGVAEFKTLPYVGNFMISSTDGNDRAHTTVNIPYFGRYAYEIAFWNAYVDIDGGDDLAGAEVIVTNSEDVEVATVTLNAHGIGVFNAKEPDYYTFTTTYASRTLTAEVDVTEQMRYSISFYAGWKKWAELGGVDPTLYNDIDELFADEVAVRRLMTIHASADYLIAATRADITFLDDFVANDTAMKWIGLRDYVCDGLTNIAGVDEEFLTSDSWERYLKDHVPVMTSINTPYGGVGVSSTYQQNDGYKAFDGNPSSVWAGNTVVSSGQSADGYIQYIFDAPICVKKIRFIGGNLTTGLTLKGSNDRIDWITLKTYTDEIITGAEEYIDVSENNNYFKTYRLEVTQKNVAQGSAALPNVHELQFYGRKLNIFVPRMISNDSPYYELSGTENSQYPLFKAFDSNSATFWVGNTADAHVIVDFKKNINIKKVSVYPRVADNHPYVKGFKIYCSDDKITWDELLSGTHADTAIAETYTIQSDEPHRYWKFQRDGNNYYPSDTTIQVAELQFYGVDYSEREFAVGSTLKYLYDHGLELEPISVLKGSNGGDVTKSNDKITIINGSSSATESRSGAGISNFDVTPYSKIFADITTPLIVSSSGGALLGALASSLVADGISTIAITTPLSEIVKAADLSNVNQSCYLSVMTNASGAKVALDELWLE